MALMIGRYMFQVVNGKVAYEEHYWNRTWYLIVAVTELDVL